MGKETFGLSCGGVGDPRQSRYIARQAEHHKQENFKSELLRILRAHEVEFDEKYVFD